MIHSIAITHYQRTMWQCVRSIYNNHIKIHPDLYISCDDIIAIHDLIYEITGISDEYDVYIKDKNNSNYTLMDTSSNILL